MTKTYLAMMTSLLMLGGAAFAAAPPDSTASDRDPYGYYSQHDHDGYYDREGNYVRYQDQRKRATATPENDDDAPPATVYKESNYDAQCRSGNNAAGTLFGAIAGGLIGGAASGGRHGPSGGAVVGGAILGGLLGNAMTRDMPCEDHPVAMHVYVDGLNGDLGRRQTWRHGDDYGDFIAESEFHRDGYVCRSFRETTFVQGRKYTETGTACRLRDGNWHFD